MPDIFLSYSRKDSEQAVALAERLRTSGLSVWIDRQGLEASMQWTKEIVEAIETCGTFVILLSNESLQSRNVLRELTIASESERTILPVNLEPVAITSEFRYLLAGIQRTRIENFDAILRAVERSGINSAPALAAPVRPANRSDNRKSLMVLPFEDMSPAQDNGWFADGLTGELISAMSNVKALRLIDRQTSMSFKNANVKTARLAKELGVRYFLEGSVRKADIAAGPTSEPQVKINVELLDVERGEYIWQYAYKGAMADIFEIQETVANKVLEGLTVHVTTAEDSAAFQHGTKNAEAYELFLRGREYFMRDTLTGCRIAASFFEQAIALDPHYANAYALKAAVHVQLYMYSRDASDLDQAEALLEQAELIDHKNLASYAPRMVLLRLQGRTDEAEAIGREYIARTPDDYLSYFQLASLYTFQKEFDKATPLLERALELNPGHRASYYNIVLAYERAGDQEKRKYWAEHALEHFAKFLRLQPEDERGRVQYANMLMDAGRTEEAHDYIATLDDVRDSRQVFEIGLLAAMLHDYPLAVQYFRRAYELGHRDFTAITPGGEDDELFNMPEFQEILARLEPENRD